MVIDIVEEVEAESADAFLPHDGLVEDAGENVADDSAE